MIGVIDYGAGNLLSVKKALDYLELENKLIQKQDDFEDFDKLVLPGVGAFEYASVQLKERGLFDPILDWLKKDQPFLGICLGLQLLFESSEESKTEKGFSLFKGQVRRFQADKVPQIGWNQVKFVQENSIFDGIPDQSFFYFLHGFYVDPEDQSIVGGQTFYSLEYCSMIISGNIYGVQFHPEKSGDFGIKFLKNWSEKC